MFVPTNGAVLADTSRQLFSGDSMLRAGGQEFKSSFNLRSFKFNHTLHQSGLFEIPRIVELAKRIIDRNGSFCALNFKQGSIDAKFSAMPESERLAETVARLGENGTWIKLNRAQDYDPDYADVLNTVTSELESLSGFPLRKDMTFVSMTLLLSSPNISTPFHIDHESNFLFQIQGSKDVCLFPATDRELVPDPEIERYYSGNFEAALYRREMQDRGTVYRLNPGEVVHHPPLAPHWVKNGDNISVSISINYCTKSLERRARVYQANYFLRMLGLNPVSPGVSPLRDSLKRNVIATLEHRNPKTFSEVVHTPVFRLKAPLNAVRRLVRR
ncbi:cupin-like domain-containing protein [Paraburkholderia phymatum]|uniref:Transcription factor jumonji jmjC domain protein n=1 Tax=Paraburkholderia phymatum (strain DSM 17167 / CIP 108236 / LMG 21445 / STM815) TaxID=391038 RepID=B2JKN7_PARP8|nr:cupin-like domain-containing protein [Paraburkholderia phymatum]ACC70864.1 transcription factor jumonji jmjC domain protein [Paraburkholderia phymatum STM815]